jgi:hypothetical protein
MSLYQKKPETVEAFQWKGDPEQDDLPDWLKEAIQSKRAVLTKRKPYHLIVADGAIHAQPGDYIIRGSGNVLRACEPHFFERTYELVEEQPDA